MYRKGRTTMQSVHNITFYHTYNISATTQNSLHKSHIYIYITFTITIHTTMSHHTSKYLQLDHTVNKTTSTKKT